MGNYISPGTGVRFVTGPDKASEASRVTRGVKIGAQAPLSAVYTGNPDVKAAADTVVVNTTALKAAMDTWASAEAAVKKARTALGLSVQGWDKSYDFFAATAAKHCTTPDDGTSVGMEVRGTTHNALAMPLSVTLRQDFKKNLLRIHVHRAPGMDKVSVEISPDPITTTSWRALDGNGARWAIPLPGKGTWWVHAASCMSHAKSDYTIPVSIILL